MIWTPGGQHGRFDLERRLGKGAFAEVWLASERGALGFSRRVALKQLRANRDEARHREDLLKEARLCAHLSHPNVISVIAVEEDEDGLVVVMEYLDGGSLGDLLGFAAEHGLRLPKSAVIDLASQLAAGLRYAHEALDEEDRPLGLVHRDLKPANVLLGRSGVAKIADFGIAKAMEDTSSTATGTLKGTVAYVAPEILSGERSFAPCVDLFALGCMLYELVLIRRLFQGEVPATVMFQIVSGVPADEVAPIREFFPEMADIIEALLQRSPAQRTASSRSVLEALQPLAALAPVGGDIGHLVDIVRAVKSPTPLKGLKIPRPVDPEWRAWLTLAATHDPQYVPALQGPDTPITAKVKVQRAPEPPTLRPPKKAKKKSRPAAPAPRTGAGRKRPQRPQRSKPRWILPALLVAVVLVLAVVLVGLLRSPSTPAPAAGGQPAAFNALPDLPVVAPAAAPRATPKARAKEPASPRATPRQRPEPVVAEATPQPTPEATPAPTPAPTPEVAAAVSNEACLILTSRPGGARVWLNGQPRTMRASSKMGSRLSRKSGSVTVGMGMTAETVSTTVTLRAGQASQVSCDLMGASGCTVTAVAMSICE